MSQNNQRPEGLPPIPPGQQPQPTGPQNETQKQLKSAQSLVLASSLMGPISLILGGVLLSSVAMVCSILGFRKLNKLTQPIEPQYEVALRQLKRTSKIALIVCMVALALNLIAFIYVFPQALEAYQDGTYVDFLMGDSNGSANNDSIWG